jgi:hypothetical protein
MPGDPVPADWCPRLVSGMAATVREYGAWRLEGQSIVLFNVGCFPWHGLLELSILTADELNSDPVLMEPGEMAAWFHYNVGVGLRSRDAVVVLGWEMSAIYNRAPESDKAGVAEAFMQACAEAAGHPDVRAALGSVGLDPRFRITVDHADDGRDFYSPPGA